MASPAQSDGVERFVWALAAYSLSCSELSVAKELSMWRRWHLYLHNNWRLRILQR